jgi:hypothetical protein
MNTLKKFKDCYNLTWYNEHNECLDCLDAFQEGTYFFPTILEAQAWAVKNLSDDEFKTHRITTVAKDYLEAVE